MSLLSHSYQATRPDQVWNSIVLAAVRRQQMSMQAYKLLRINSYATLAVLLIEKHFF